MSAASSTYHGSCLCGQVSFQVEADPIVISCCHCSNCKKYTGTVFTTNVVFPAGSVTITRGAALVSTYKDTAQDQTTPTNTNHLERHFCSLCGSPLYNSHGDGGRTLAVFYSALELEDFCVDEDESGTGLGTGKGVCKKKKKKKEPPRPNVEYYTKDRVEWLRPVEGAEQAWTKPGRG